VEKVCEFGSEYFQRERGQKVECLGGIDGFVGFGFLFRDIDGFGVVPMDFIGA